MPVALIPSMPNPILNKRRANTLRSFARGAGYTHACPSTHASMLQLYELDTCKRCGCSIQAPYSVLVAATLEVATLGWLVVQTSAPDEGAWSELHNTSTCTGCCYTA